MQQARSGWKRHERNRSFFILKLILSLFFAGEFFCEGAEKIFPDPLKVELVTEKLLLLTGTFSGFYHQQFRKIHAKPLQTKARSIFTKPYMLEMAYRAGVMDLVQEYRGKICEEFRRENSFVLYGPGRKRIRTAFAGYRLLPRGRLFKDLPVDVAQFLVEHQVLLYNQAGFGKGKYILEGPFGAVHSFELDPEKDPCLFFQVRDLYPADPSGARVICGSFWTGTGKKLDLSKYVNEQFQVVSSGSGKIVLQGKIRLHRGERRFAREAVLRGGDVLIFDLSPLQKEGNYFLRVPGLGVSKTFRITHTAGWAQCSLYLDVLKYSRCHHCHINTARGDYPGERSAYRSSGKKGNKSGFFTAWGERVNHSLRSFLYSTERKEYPLISGLFGGWHEDPSGRKEPVHLDAVNSILCSLLWAPGKQGFDRMLQEALYGLDLYKRMQTESGSVALRVEVSPHNYGELLAAHPDRKSTLGYARSAALASLVLRECGQTLASREYLHSALKAWTFALDEKNTLKRTYRTVRKNQVVLLHYQEEAFPEGHTLLECGCALYLLTGDKRFLQILNQYAAGIYEALKNYGKTLSGSDFAVFLWKRIPDHTLQIHYSFLRDLVLKQAQRCFRESGPWVETGHPGLLLEQAQLLAAGWFVWGEKLFYHRAWLKALTFSGWNASGRDLVKMVPGVNSPDREEEISRVWGLYFPRDIRRKKAPCHVQLFPGKGNKTLQNLSRRRHRALIDKSVPLYYRSIVSRGFSGKRSSQSLIARCGAASGLFYLLQIR